MTHKFYILVCFTLLLSLSHTMVFAQERITGTITHDGLERDYRLYIPAAYDGESDWPLVFNFHGFTSNAGQQEVYSNMNAVADTAHFIVCYPDGVGNAWNVDWPFGSTADDVGFVDALIDELSNNYRVNAARIYACGMSNGGFMSYRLACELNNRIAAVASVTGSLALNFNCNPERAVPVLQIHGTADDVVPYDGNDQFTISVDSTIAFWVANNGCSTTPEYLEVPNINTSDSSTAEQFTYNECNDDSEVMLFKVTNGQHTWPGSPITFPGTNYDINASEEIWRFFQRFTNPGVVNTQEQTASLELNVFPNPSYGKVTFSGITTPFTVQIFNGFGQLIGQRIVDEPQVDFSNLPKGTYFLQVQQDAQVGWTKWVKL